MSTSAFIDFCLDGICLRRIHQAYEGHPASVVPLLEAVARKAVRPADAEEAAAWYEARLRAEGWRRGIESLPPGEREAAEPGYRYTLHAHAEADLLRWTLTVSSAGRGTLYEGAPGDYLKKDLGGWSVALELPWSAVVFDRPMKRAAALISPLEIGLIDLDTHQPCGRLVIPGSAATVAATSVMAFSPPGALIAAVCRRTSGGQEYAHVRPVQGRHPGILLTPPFPTQIHAVRISVDEKKLLMACDSGKLLLWDLAGGALEREFELAPPRDGLASALACAIDPSGRYVAAGGTSSPAIARLWDLRSGTLKGEFERAGRVTALAFAPRYQLAIGGAWHDLEGRHDPQGVVVDLAEDRSRRCLEQFSLAADADSLSDVFVCARNEENASIVLAYDTRDWTLLGRFVAGGYRATAVGFDAEAREAVACVQPIGAPQELAKFVRRRLDS